MRNDQKITLGGWIPLVSGRRICFHFIGCLMPTLLGINVHRNLLNVQTGVASPTQVEWSLCMRKYVDRGTIAGTVTLVARHKDVVHLEAVGYQDLERRVPMRTDTIFQVMSMTKPVTAAGIMILLEEGRLSLEDPVQKFLPEFREARVVEHRAKTGQSLRRATRAITIRNLLTHTSGMSGEDPPAIRDPAKKRSHTLADNVLFFSRQALEFDPGTQWMYSGPGYATLGRIIEVVSKAAYERFLQDRIFEPLGMKDTSFFPPAQKGNRIARVYLFQDGKLRPADADSFQADAKYPNPAGGLYSTASDMGTFLLCMLNGGSWHDRTILSKASVGLMTRVQTGDLPVQQSPVRGFGLGWEVLRTLDPALPWFSAGTYGHAGAFGTYEWVDPGRDLIGVFLIQRLGESSTQERDAFITSIYTRLPQ